MPLRQIVISLAGAMLVIGFVETLIFAVIDQGLHRPASFIGVLETAQGVGAIAGGLTAAAALRRFGDGRITGAGLFGFALGDALLIPASLPLALAGAAIAGASLAWAIVGFATAIQRRSPAELQGRVYSAADTAISVPQVISIALGAALSTVVRFQILLAIVVVVTAAWGIYLLSRRAFADLNPPAVARPVEAQPAD